MNIFIYGKTTVKFKVWSTVYPKKYAHGFCFAVLCCGYTSTDFPISIRLTSLALWQSNDCPSASKATLMNMDKYFMWIHYERLHNHNKAKHNKTVCIFLGTYCSTPRAERPLTTWTVRRWFSQRSSANSSWNTTFVYTPAFPKKTTSILVPIFAKKGYLFDGRRELANREKGVVFRPRLGTSSTTLAFKWR